MVKNNLLPFLALCFFIFSCGSNPGNQDGVYDTRAVEVLDKMTETIGALNSCSYTLNTYMYEHDAAGQAISYSKENDVYMRGPDKMHIRVNGTKGEYGYWYDGSELSYYNYDQNIHDIVDAPERIRRP